MSTPSPTPKPAPSPAPEPEVVVIREKPDDGNIWMWAIFGIILIAIILIVVGVCLSNKHHKKLVYMTSNAGVPPSVAPSSYAPSLQGGSFLAGGGAVSVAPLTASMLNSSVAPMSFMPY